MCNSQGEAIKKLHNKIFKIKDEIYWFDIWLIVGDKEYYKEYLKRRKIIYEESGNRGGETIVTDIGIFVWIPRIDFTSSNYGILGHELLHVAFRVMEQIGFKFDYGNTEPINYYFEHLMTDTLWKLTKYLRK